MIDIILKHVKDIMFYIKKKSSRTKNALAGNRTRAARVAGEHSTTEPPVLVTQVKAITLAMIKL